MCKAKKILDFTLLTIFVSLFVNVSTALALNTVNERFGTIRGVVRDENGTPISGAIVALMREGLSEFRQVTSSGDGEFSARVAPGIYTLTAMAQGFSVVSLGNVEVERSTDIAFRFNLIRVGNGETLPERRQSKNRSKWILRGNLGRKSIYQHNEGDDSNGNLPITNEDEIAEDANAESGETETVNDFRPTQRKRQSQSIVEIYSANTGKSDFSGINFATFQPVNENLQFTIAGQTGIGENAPQLFVTNAKVKISDNHTLDFSANGANLGKVGFDDTKPNDLGFVSLQAIDEWQVKEGIIVVFGVDYARFVGASNATSINPRVGLQFDANAKTRVKAAYTTKTEQKTWQQATELEDNSVVFRQNILEPIAVVDKKIVLPKFRRIEFGFERVLDNSSSVEATIFLDSVTNRGLNFVTFSNLDSAQNNENNLFANGLQNGSTQGVRVVYARRLNKVFSTSLAYAFGKGQELSQNGVTNPKDLLEDSLFQTFAAQISADFQTGTKINAIYRVAPRNTVLAIDPFAGRLNNYAPSVSVLVTQNLPTMGLPIRAKAIIDAQNLLDWQAKINDGANSLKLDSSRCTLRGGIAVRF